MTKHQRGKRMPFAPTVILALLLASPLAGQQTPSIPVTDTLELRLEDAVRRAVEGSQEVAIAREQARYAAAQVRIAKADIFPQISGNINYTRTFDSPFDTGEPTALPDSLIFDPDPTAPIEDRIRYLEENAALAGMAGLGSLFGDLPFGREHAWTFSLNGTQTLFSPSLGSAIRIAGEVRNVAALRLREQQAEIELQVRTAYVRAQLARELEQISVEALAQAERFLSDEQLRFEAGTTSELDVLRAQVEQANLEPALIEARNNAHLAELELKRLLDLPMEQPLELVSEMVVPAAALDMNEDVPPELLIGRRAAIEAAEREVTIRRHQVTMARNAFLPSLKANMNYGQLAYPDRMFGLGGQQWRTDWNAALIVEVPIFSGFRRLGQTDAARSELAQAELALAQLREAVQLDFQQTRGERESARVALAARELTVGQAERVHDLTVLRYERGLATQLEVADARLALLRARTNLVQALTDFHVADAGVRRALGTSVITSTLPVTR